MANKKITELDAITDLTDDDLLVVIDDVAGTPTSKKITKANALKNYLAKDNTTEFIPDANYEPATKKYVDDSVSGAGGGDMLTTTYDPAGGAEQVAFASDLGTASAEDITAFAPALGEDDNYVTDAEKTVIGNTSGTNTGDQDLSGLIPNVPLATEDNFASFDDAGDVKDSSSKASDFATAGHDHDSDYEPLKGEDDNYVTDAQLTVIGNTSGTNTGDQDIDDVTPTTTKGDLLVEDGTNVIRLGVGTDDQVLTADSAEASGVKWADAGGGGGQTVVTKIVDADGTGDFTTLKEAVETVGNDGWRILVRSDTTETGNISFSSRTNITIEGMGRENTVVNMGAYYFNTDCSGLVLKDLTISSSTGYNALNGADLLLENVTFTRSGAPSAGSAGVSIGGSANRSRVIHCNFISTATANVNGTLLTTSGFVKVDGCRFDIGSYGWYQILYVSYAGSQVTNNYFYSNANFNSSTIATSTATDIMISNNMLISDNSTATNIGINVTGARAIISNNLIRQYKNAIKVKNNSVVSDNNIYLYTSSYGIYQTTGSMGNSTITGNTFWSDQTTTNYGIYLGASVYLTNTVIANNSFYYLNTAITTGTNAYKYSLVGNTYDTCTTNCTLSGLRSVQDGYGARALDQVSLEQCKNTSGGTIGAGEVVTLNATAGGNEITRTTSAGDNKVYGIAVESIANNATGAVQISGISVVTCKVDGTTDIAIGDYLTCFTTAGIMAKASAGNTVIGMALAGYTTDDSSGLISVKILTPRLI